MRATALFLSVASLVLACGGESPGDDTGGGGQGGSATGGSATGGAPSGGATTGGESSGGGDASGGNGGGGDEFCTPGDFVMGAFLFSGTMTNCADWDPGDAGVDESLSARSIELPTAMTAGQPYAISFGYLLGGSGTLEYYATDGECGPVLEKLSSEAMNQRKLICTDTSPAGDYTHLVMLWRDIGGASLDDATFCANTSCP